MTDETAKEIVRSVVWAWRKHGGRNFRADVVAATVKTIAAGKPHFIPDEDPLK